MIMIWIFSSHQNQNQMFQNCVQGLQSEKGLGLEPFPSVLTPVPKQSCVDQKESRHVKAWLLTGVNVWHIPA